MPKWTDPAEQRRVMALARECRNSNELAARLGVRPDRLRSGWAKASKTSNLPPLSSLWRQDWADDEPTNPGYRVSEEDTDIPITIEEPEPEVKLPARERVREVPPDHIIRVDPPASGYTLVTSDHHHPIQDKAAEAAIVALARDLRPDTWVANGDVLDAWWISRHDKEAERLVDRDAGQRIVDEVESFRPTMDAMASVCRRAYIGIGNHENRLSALINANPGLHGLPGLEWRAIINPPANVQVMRYGYRLQTGPMSFVHGDRIGGKFGLRHPTTWVLDRQGARSQAFGHTHRMGMALRTTWEDDGPRQVVAINHGHLSDASKQRYVVEPDWQTGFLVLEWWTEAGRARFTPHMIPILNGRFTFAGKVYDGRRWQ